MQSMNPATEAVIRDYPELSPEETDERLDMLEQVQQLLRKLQHDQLTPLAAGEIEKAYGHLL